MHGVCSVTMASDTSQQACQCRAASSLLASCMDGSIHVLDAATGAIEGKHRPHTKYCVRALWLPQASGLISCGWDCNLSIHSLPGEFCAASWLCAEALCIC